MEPTNPYKARNQAWIDDICDDLGITYTELARRAGVDTATLTRFMNNPKYKPNLSDTTLQKIAEAVRRPLPQTDARNHPLPRTLQLPTVKVVGTASAGLWKDVSIIAAGDYEYEEIPVINNARYAGHEQYALLVEGESINRKIKDGEYAVCVSWDGLGISPATGQYVHVERSRGGLQEATIKRIKVIDGQIELWPDSDDLRFREPLRMDHADDDTEVRIRGLVIGTYRHFE